MMMAKAIPQPPRAPHPLSSSWLQAAWPLTAIGAARLMVAATSGSGDAPKDHILRDG